MKSQLLLGFVAGLFMITNIARAQEFVDQQCMEVWSCYAINFFEPMGQEFVPSFSEHTAVELYIDDPNIGSPVEPITVSIRQFTINGPVVASVTADVPNAEPGWIRFEFPSPVQLDPGETYVIEVSTTTNRWSWCRSQDFSGCYEPGGVYLEGVLDDNFDFAFKTLVTAGGSDCAADLDGDGEVDIVDLLELLASWGPCP